MSYFNAVRKAGTCRNGDCEEHDYIYDAPHFSSKAADPAPRTSYYAIEHTAHSDDTVHLTPDAWEDLLLPIAA